MELCRSETDTEVQRRLFGRLALDHLIEDYDVTAKLKVHGWNVGLADKSVAATDAPTTLSTLWKQRVRWYVGGLFVLGSNIKKPLNVIQDIFGHFTLIASYILIILSYVLGRYSSIDQSLVNILIILALANFFIPTLFNLFTLKYYKDKDWIDVVIRLILIPEFIYANILTATLLGSYAFYVYSKAIRNNLHKSKLGTTIVRRADRLFFSMGYSNTWGTR